MKKLIIIIPLIILISGCIVIDERYRTPGPRVVVESGNYYDYYPSYYYGGFYGDPFYYWMGAGWWNPFWYYGFYNYYYGWYYPRFGSYYYYYPSRYYVRGSDVITKDQLQDPNKTRTSGRKIRYTERTSVSRLSKGSSQRSTGKRVIGRSSGRRITGTVSRSGSSGARSIRSTGSSSGSRSRSSGSTSKVKKK